MENETGKLSFDRLFLLSGIYALFYTVCLYKNKMGITFPVFGNGRSFPVLSAPDRTHTEEGIRPLSGRNSASGTQCLPDN